MHPHIERVEELLTKRKRSEAKRILSKLHPADIASIIDHLPGELQVQAFLLLDTDAAAEVILEVGDSTRRHILHNISNNRLADMVEELESDDAADLVMSLPKRIFRRVLSMIPKKDVREISKLIKYPEETAGGMMQLEHVVIPIGATVKEAIAEIRKKAKDVENLHNVFVVDKEGKIRGVLSLRRLLLAKPYQKVSSIMNRKVISVKADLDREDVAQKFMKYDLVSMPVIDNENRLLGRITVDDVMDVLEEESTEDIYRLAGLGKDESVLDPPFRSLSRRLPWLLINLGTAIIAANVVGLFESTIAKFAFLAVFMPIIAGMGGNAGTQTLTIIVRGIALGELDLHRYKNVLLKELFLGLANGAVTGLVMGFIAYLWKGLPILGLIIFMAMTANLIVASLVGTLVPILLKKLKIDPALASSIIVTTFTDATGFFAFLGLASILLKVWV